MNEVKRLACEHFRANSNICLTASELDETLTAIAKSRRIELNETELREIACYIKNQFPANVAMSRVNTIELLYRVTQTFEVKRIRIYGPRKHVEGFKNEFKEFRESQNQKQAPDTHLFPEFYKSVHHSRQPLSIGPMRFVVS